MRPVPDENPAALRAALASVARSAAQELLREAPDAALVARLDGEAADLRRRLRLADPPVREIERARVPRFREPSGGPGEPRTIL